MLGMATSGTDSMIGKLARAFDVARLPKYVGRGLLLAGAAVILSLVLQRVVREEIIVPRADYGQSGWWMEFTQPARPVGVDGYEVFLQSGKLVNLNPDFKKAVGYMIWNTPVTGKYKISLAAVGRCRLAVDGETMMTATGSGKDAQPVSAWVDLTAGEHVLRMANFHEQGGGWFSIQVQEPPKMRNRSLEKEEVAAPHLGSLHTWWWVMAVSRMAMPVAGALLLLLLGRVLLPFAVGNRYPAVVLSTGILLLPSLLAPGGSQREPYIGPMIHEQLRAKHPAFVFIGNSMLWSRIDDRHLEELLHGEGVFSIVNFGGFAPIHYLSFKYLFLPSGIRPKRVFIFFRDTSLLLTSERTNGPYFEQMIERLTPAPDAVFELLARGKNQSVQEKVAGWLRQFFPVMNSQAAVRQWVNTGTANVLVSVMGNGRDVLTGEQLLEQVNTRFSMSGNRAQQSDLESKSLQAHGDEYDFAARVPNSFLPHILDLAHENGIALAFIRVQTRPGPNGKEPDPPQLKQFIDAQRLYLEEHGAAFYDFTGDPELPESAYRDGDHILDQVKYTDLFYRRVGHLLQ